MKVKKSHLLELGVILCVLINIYFGYFFGVALTSPFRITNIVIVMMLFLLFAWRGSNNEYKALKSRIMPFFFVGAFCLLAEIVYSMYCYSQTFMEVLVCWEPYIYLLLVGPLLYVFSSRKAEKILYIIALITAVGILLRLVQAVAYNVNGLVIFPTLIEYGVSGIRNDNVRLSMTSLAYVSTVVLFYYVLCSKKKKVYHWILLGTNLMAYLYMAQSRVMIAVIGITLIAMYWAKVKPKNRQLWVLGILLVLCIILGCTDYLSDYVSSFSVDSEFGGGSTLTRLLAIEYYWNSPYRSPILGMGFINEGDYLRYLILHRTNTSMQAYYSDIGVLGLYFNLGLIGIALYAYFFARLFKALRLGLAKDPGPEKILIVGFFTYYLFSSVSLLILVASSIFSVPFIWAYAEIYIYRINKLYCGNGV